MAFLFRLLPCLSLYSQSLLFVPALLFFDKTRPFLGKASLVLFLNLFARCFFRNTPFPRFLFLLPLVFFFGPSPFLVDLATDLLFHPYFLCSKPPLLLLKPLLGFQGGALEPVLLGLAAFFHRLLLLPVDLLQAAAFLRCPRRDLLFNPLPFHLETLARFFLDGLQPLFLSLPFHLGCFTFLPLLFLKLLALLAQAGEHFFFYALPFRLELLQGLGFKSPSFCFQLFSRFLQLFSRLLLKALALLLLLLLSDLLLLLLSDLLLPLAGRFSFNSLPVLFFEPFLFLFQPPVGFLQPVFDLGLRFLLGLLFELFALLFLRLSLCFGDGVPARLLVDLPALQFRGVDALRCGDGTGGRIGGLCRIPLAWLPISRFIERTGRHGRRGRR